MRLVSLVLVALLATAVARPAQATDESLANVQRFGAVVVEKKPVNLAKLQKKPASFSGRTLRIEGVVKDVCQGRGCWVEVQDARGATFIAKRLDESVLLPKDCKGQRIVVQGVVQPLAARGHDH